MEVGKAGSNFQKTDGQSESLHTNQGTLPPFPSRLLEGTTHSLLHPPGTLLSRNTQHSPRKDLQTPISRCLQWKKGRLSTEWPYNEVHKPASLSHRSPISILVSTLKIETVRDEHAWKDGSNGKYSNQNKQKKGLDTNKDNTGEAENSKNKQNTTYISEFIAPMKQKQDVI